MVRHRPVCTGCCPSSSLCTAGRRRTGRRALEEPPGTAAGLQQLNGYSPLIFLRVKGPRQSAQITLQSTVVLVQAERREGYGACLSCPCPDNHESPGIRCAGRAAETDPPGTHTGQHTMKHFPLWTRQAELFLHSSHFRFPKQRTRRPVLLSLHRFLPDRCCCYGGELNGCMTKI